MAGPGTGPVGVTLVLVRGESLLQYPAAHRRATGDHGGLVWHLDRHVIKSVFGGDTGPVDGSFFRYLATALWMGLLSSDSSR